MRRFFKVTEGEQRYGAKTSAWRKWVLNGSLGEAVVCCGRLVLLDSVILDERLARTGQLLISSPGAPRRKAIRLTTAQIESNGLLPNKRATDSHSVARRRVRGEDATLRT
jgi:hypothetical protein